MFFIKKSVIVLDCFTDIPFVYDYAKIDRGIKFLPEWWKKTPKMEGDAPTIKNCQGLIDFYLDGFAIPSWFSLNLKIKSLDESIRGDKWTWTSSNVETEIEYHFNQQFTRFAKQDSSNLKFINPWLFKTKENISFTLTQPTWNHRDWLNNLVLLPGVMHFKNQLGCNLNFLIINGIIEKNVIIEPLTPLAMLHPLTEKKVIIKSHLVDKMELQRLDGYNKYLSEASPQEVMVKRFNRKKFFEKVDILNKCPYK